jgi:DNA-binding IclR family transcriptional regulator
MPKDRVAAAETGAEMLRSFAELGGPLALTAIANHTGMPAGKVHRYLRAFVASGMLVQHTASRAYDLGPLAFSLGIAALRRYDIVNAASVRLTEFCSISGESASLLVWGTNGPTVIRSENSRQDIVVVLRVGGTVRITTSSAGRVFAAHLSDDFIAPFVAAECAAADAPRTQPTAQQFAAIVDNVRLSGFAPLVEGPIDGVSAISAPLFGAGGHCAGVISAVGRRGAIDLAPDGRVARALTRFISSLDPRSSR